MPRPSKDVGRDAAEVADPRQDDVDQPVEELVHPPVAEGDVAGDGLALPQLEGRDRLLGPPDARQLAGDLGQLGLGRVQELDVLDGVADADVDDDLLQAGHGHDIRDAELLLELGDHVFPVLVV